VNHFYTDTALLDDRGHIGDGPGTGELLVKGPNVFRGYWRRPEATEEAIASGWFRSGDIIRMGEDGWAEVVDRVKDMIISGGENISPAEVEAVLLQLPDVSEAAVIGVPDEQWGEVGRAFLVAQPGVVIDEQVVRRHLEHNLARFKLPKSYLVVDALPRTASGKVRKAELRAASRTAPDDRHAVG
jgi:fatty-acyl-CoA synthase